MKSYKKSTSLFLIIFMSVILVVGLVFAFIPMNFGSTKYLSFAGNIKYASELKAGMYAEYTASGDVTRAQMNTAVDQIKSILSNKGHTGAFVAAVGDKSIRVEVGLETGGEYTETQSLLATIGVGVFELRTGTEKTKTFISGREHITEITTGSASGSSYVKISFNEKGLQAYKANMKSGTTIYVYMGDELQTSFSGSDAAYDDMYLNFETYAEAEKFATSVKFGSFIPVDFDKTKTEINTMSSPFSTVGLTADINSAAYNKSNTFVLLFVALLACVTAAIVFMVVKHRAFGVANLLSMLILSVIITYILQLLPWIEIGLSALISIAVSSAMTFMGAFIYIGKVGAEFSLGKTLEASLESGFKKSAFINAVIAGLMFVAGLFMAFLTSGAVATAAIILAVFGAAYALNNILLLPWFISIFYSFEKKNTLAYGLGGQKND